MNNKRETIKEVTQKIPIILFTPDSLSCIKMESSRRKDLIDDFIPLICLEGHKIIRSYKKVLKVRNKILRDFLKKRASLSQTESLLDSIEKSYLERATLLTLIRYRVLKALEPVSREILLSLCSVSGFLEVKYRISGEVLKKEEANFDTLYNAMQNKISERKTLELAQGSTLVGPQKHDISFFYRNQDSRFYCSQGEQRILILALKIAQIMYYKRERGFYPILMLDDVFSELDQKNQENLVEFLNKLKTQIFLTTTERHPLLEKLYKKNFLRIKEIKQ